MDVRDYLRAVRRHWWMVVSAVVLGVGAGVGVTAMTPPEYAASVTFFVGTQTKGVSDAYQGSLFSQQRIKSYADLLTSDRLARVVVAREPAARSTSRVQAAITATPVPDTVLLQATVTDRNRSRAVVLTRAVADAFVDLVRTLETPPGSSSPTVWVEVVAGPALAEEPVAPQPLRNTALGLAVGLLLGVGAAGDDQRCPPGAAVGRHRGEHRRPGELGERRGRLHAGVEHLAQHRAADAEQQPDRQAQRGVAHRLRRDGLVGQGGTGDHLHPDGR